MTKVTYDEQKTRVDSAPDVPRSRSIFRSARAASGHLADVQRSDEHARQRSSDDHRRVSARMVRSCPSTQCTGVPLRAGGFRCDAGEGRKTSDADTRPNLL